MVPIIKSSEDNHVSPTCHQLATQPANYKVEYTYTIWICISRVYFTWFRFQMPTKKGANKLMGRAWLPKPFNKIELHCFVSYLISLYMLSKTVFAEHLIKHNYVAYSPSHTVIHEIKISKCLIILFVVGLNRYSSVTLSWETAPLDPLLEQLQPILIYPVRPLLLTRTFPLHPTGQS